MSAETKEHVTTHTQGVPSESFTTERCTWVQASAYFVGVPLRCARVRCTRAVECCVLVGILQRYTVMP